MMLFLRVYKLWLMICKISKNRKRDDEVNKKLLFMGWTVIRFWGNDIKNNTDECIKVIDEAVFEIKLGQNDIENEI